MEASKILELIKEEKIEPEYVMLFVEEDTDILSLTNSILQLKDKEKYAGYVWRKSIIMYPEKAKQAVQEISIKTIYSIVDNISLLLWDDHYEYKNIIDHKVVTFFIPEVKKKWEERLDGITEPILFVNTDILKYTDLIPEHKLNLILYTDSDLIKCDDIYNPNRYTFIPKIIVHPEQEPLQLKNTINIDFADFVSHTGIQLSKDRFWKRIDYIWLQLKFEKIDNDNLLLKFDTGFRIKSRTRYTTYKNSDLYERQLKKQLDRIFKPIKIPVKIIPTPSSMSADEIFKKLKEVQSCIHQQ